MQFDTGFRSCRSRPKTASWPCLSMTGSSMPTASASRPGSSGICCGTILRNSDQIV